jgi:hypothetical protein
MFDWKAEFGKQMTLLHLTPSPRQAEAQKCHLVSNSTQKYTYSRLNICSLVESK